jgi:hypothetical protein
MVALSLVRALFTMQKQNGANRLKAQRDLTQTMTDRPEDLPATLHYTLQQPCDLAGSLASIQNRKNK